MSKNKLTKFAELNRFLNVYQYDHVEKKALINGEGEEVEIAGKWREHFGNKNPITLELACGEGYYALAMAERFPDRNFVGVDIKGNRMWQAAKNALDAELTNVAYLRARIEDIADFFAENEVDEIWITFPDPHLKTRRRFKRMTYSRFLQNYQHVLKPQGIVHLKTDSRELYEFTKLMLERHACEVLTDNDDIYGQGHDEPLLDIKTRYEKMHLANELTIKYLKFRFPDEPITYDRATDKIDENLK